MKITVKRLRALDCNGGIVTQGGFVDCEDIKNRIIERGLGEKGTFGVQEETKNGWFTIGMFTI